MTGESAEPSGGVQSVDRAIVILEILARKGLAGISEIAQEIGIHKSTVSRLLVALVNRGLVQQDHDRGKYRLGFGILRLAATIPGQLHVVQEGGQILRELAETFEETVNLAVMRSDFAVNVDQAMGPSTLATQDWIGSLTPLHATASGKVLLSGLGSDERYSLLQRTELQSFTSNTVTDVGVLNQQLLDVAKQGYALTEEEYEFGLVALAVPVFNHMGQIFASISISGPTFRFDPMEQPGLLETLQQAGLNLSQRMGYTSK